MLNDAKSNHIRALFISSKTIKFKNMTRIRNPLLQLTWKKEQSFFWLNISFSESLSNNSVINLEKK